VRIFDRRDERPVGAIQLLRVGERHDGEVVAHAVGALVVEQCAVTERANGKVAHLVAAFSPQRPVERVQR
jgi:hypothetical protein